MDSYDPLTIHFSNAPLRAFVAGLKPQAVRPLEKECSTKLEQHSACWWFFWLALINPHKNLRRPSEKVPIWVL